MKVANVEGRACIVTEAGGVDVAAASSGLFSSLVDELIPVLDEVADWFADQQPDRDPSLATSVLCKFSRLA